ncbi:receptor-type tyrosine-protein phosphatase H-like [Sander vitreus]
MKPLPLKIISDHFMLYVFLCLLWGVTDSNITTTTGKSATQANTTTQLTTPLTTRSTTKPPPEKVKNVTVLTQNESSITLMWDKVNNISSYFLQYGTKEDTINVVEGPSVEHVVTSLSPGTKYNFTLITEFERVNSTGYKFEAVTAPRNVDNVTVLTQNESSITLMWDKVNNISSYFLQYGTKEDTINAVEGPSVEHVVTSLSPGTKYNFTLITEFERVNSTGYKFEAVTAPRNVDNVTVLTQNESSITLMWDKVNIISSYFLQYGTKEDTINVVEGPSVEHVVTSLSPGTKYNFTLITEFEGFNSTGYKFEAVTAPRNVDNVTVLTQNERSITLMWDKINNISSYFLQYGTKEDTINAVEGPSVEHVVTSLSPGTKYNFTLITEFERVNSTGYKFEAVTAPRNVDNVTVLTQNESSITLMWDKVNNISSYFLQYGTKEDTINAVEGPSVEHVVTSLSPGTKYNFTLITEFEGFNSTGYKFEAVTAPRNVDNVTVLTQNESSITLMWDKVNNISSYFLQYGTKEDTINAVEGPSVEHVVTSLSPGTKYNFTLITEFEGFNSTGYKFEAVTAPRNVDNVTVLTQNERSITLMWDKVNIISSYFLQYGTKEDTINAVEGPSVEHVVTSLSPGTKYNFTLITEFEGFNSTGYKFEAVTGR